MLDSLALAVTVPLLAALLVTALPGRVQTLGVIGAIATALVSLQVTVQVWQLGSLRSDPGGWGAPRGLARQACADVGCP